MSGKLYEEVMAEIVLARKEGDVRREMSAVRILVLGWANTKPFLCLWNEHKDEYIR